MNGWLSFDINARSELMWSTEYHVTLQIWDYRTLFEFYNIQLLHKLDSVVLAIPFMLSILDTTERTSSECSNHLEVPQ